jgi:hypothetical protein
MFSRAVRCPVLGFGLSIVSPDGNVYVHWEFHSDPFDACTTRDARPYLLKGVP